MKWNVRIIYLTLLRRGNGCVGFKEIVVLVTAVGGGLWGKGSTGALVKTKSGSGGWSERTPNLSR